jgi:hypothetical protein
MHQSQNLKWAVALLFTLALIMGWNYWLPIAEDFYNLPTPAKEKRSFELRNVDFFAYYNAGRRFERGDNPYYYTGPVQVKLSEYIYPPTLLPFYGLISRLEYNQARLSWLAIYGLSYCLSFILLLWAARPESRLTLAACGLALTTASFPLLQHIHLGQSDVLVISMVLAGFVAYIKGFKTASAFLFALATAAKASPLLFLIYFVLFLREFRFLLAFCLCGAGLVLISLLVVPYGLYLDYIFQVLPEVSQSVSFWVNQSILKFVPASRKALAQAISLAGFSLFALFAGWLGMRTCRLRLQPGRWESTTPFQRTFFS